MYGVVTWEGCARVLDLCENAHSPQVCLICGICKACEVDERWFYERSVL